jgi:cytochrome b561
MSKPSKYPKAMIAIHWLTVILVGLVFYKGTTLENLEFTEANMNTFRSHAIPGMLILILTVVRFFLKRKNKHNLPEDIAYYGSAHKMLVESANKLIYVLLILAPLVGFVMVYKTGAFSYDLGGAFPEGAEFDDTLEVLHKLFVFSLVGLIVLHVAGVVVYKFKKGENLMKRVCLLLK